MTKKKKINSVEKEQKDLSKVNLVLKKPKLISYLNYLFLTPNQKNIYKKILKDQKINRETKKANFDKDNVFEVVNYNFWYNNGAKQALYDINLNIKRNKVTALIGPSGCGKSTFIRCLNSLNDQIENVVYNGNIYFDDGTNIKSESLSTLELTTRVGMVFQKPTPFSMSIYDNVAYGPRSHGIYDKKILDKIVEQSLKDAALWDEVKNNLFDLGTSLSGGQQQRLCIARAVALKPEVLLMDEPTSGLDPIATSKIENLIDKLKNKFTIIIVTHSMAQAQRISDFTAFFYQGHLIEIDTTKKIFTQPRDKKTRDYISGKIG